MELSSYFDPIDFSLYIRNKDVPSGYTLGETIVENTMAISKTGLNHVDAVIVGVPVHYGKRQKAEADSPGFIRKALYSLAAFDSNLNIVDLGNLKPAPSLKDTLFALRDVVEYLKYFHIPVVVLGGSQNLTLGICDAYKTDKYFWLSVIDATLDGSIHRKPNRNDNYLSSIFNNLPSMFQFSLIGYQQHLLSDQHLKDTAGGGSHLRLGELRADILQAELLLRNSNVVSFDMGALKYNEAPSTSQKHPNGLYAEEACQLAYFAGLSHRLEVFGLFEMLPLKKDPVTPALAAEIIWYFFNGLSKHNPGNMETAYKVEIEGLEQPIVFRHDRILDRWWFDAESMTGETIKIACSHKDYQIAASNEIPERWLHFIQKMDSIPK